MDAEHPELRSYAQSQGWWTGEGEFNFSEVFSPVEDHLDCGAGKDSLEKQEGELVSPSRFFLISLSLAAVSENLSELRRVNKEEYRIALVCKDQLVLKVPDVQARKQLVFIFTWCFLIPGGFLLLPMLFSFNL